MERKVKRFDDDVGKNKGSHDRHVFVVSNDLHWTDKIDKNEL